MKLVLEHIVQFMEFNSNPAWLPTVREFKMGSDAKLRETLLGLIKNIRLARENSLNDSEILSDFEKLLPGTDVSNLCSSDYDNETIVDICIDEKDTDEKLDENELLLLVKRLQSTDPSATFNTEADSVKAVLLFNKNCKHPARSDLIFFAEDHFDGEAYPKPEAIVEKAIRGE